jgi:RNA polymerase sigma-70 factor (ECF subfamily)
VDGLLVGKILSGNTNAFSEIIKNTEGLVAQIVFKMVSNNEDRKDISQDIYFKVFKNLGSFKYQSKLSTWIAQIAYNTCLNYSARKKLILLGNNTGETDWEETGSLDALSTKFNPLNNDVEKQMFQKELSGILKNEIEKLSPIYKTLITLYHSEELSYGEIAQITALPAGTVKNYLFRARKTLNENLSLIYKKDAL